MEKGGLVAFNSLYYMEIELSSGDCRDCHSLSQITGGKWKSQIPSMNNAEMVSEYKTDGTFTCGFPNIPGYEGPFNGAYLVFEDKMASWLDFEGVATYKFVVNANNTIKVTEFDNMEEGNTSVFTRIQN
jgi:hypothetical protein